ncbi:MULTISPECIES: cupin [Paenibacillus]|uniref:Cupin n=1 Tax=Paenibacillus campinasensis TaxID=66347 RepID=A0ABW9SZD9_9BACL|nr:MULTISPECIES: cupin [Paenibacillus]MUG66354.1 cupin [Paenibacillus campinasensis]PAK54446.1 cupin [Paenibacillus sp. 7541]
MKADIYAHEGQGIQCVYRNEKWLVCIKNWKPDNDINGLYRLEVHRETDEQFILVHGQAILIVADRKDNQFDIELIRMEAGKVYNVPQDIWFYTIMEKDAIMMYVQDANTTEENSEYCNLNEAELAYIRARAGEILNT